VQVHHIRGDLELSNVSFAYQMRPSHLVGQRIDLDPSSNRSILLLALTHRIYNNLFLGLRLSSFGYTSTSL